MKYFVRILVWGFIGFHVSLLIFLSIPAVQAKLSDIISKELQKVLRTEVSIGRVDLALFNRIIIEDVLLDDLQGEEMLKVDRLSARFEWRPLLEGKIVINSVQLFDFFIRLKQEKPGEELNCQFVLDAFASKDTLKEPANLDLRINSILIRQGEFSYDVLSAPETAGKFNPSHIGIRKLSASISLKTLRNDTLNATIRRLGFEEKSGFELKKLALKLLADDKHLTLNDFSLDLKKSVLKTDSLIVQYDSLHHLLKMTDDVHYTGSLKGNLYPSDFSPFLPALKQLDNPIDLRVDLQGQGKRLEIPVLSLSDEQHLKIQANAALMNWGNLDNMEIETNLTDFIVTRQGIDYFMNGMTGSVPPLLQRAGYIDFKGSANGLLHHLTVKGNLKTKAGSVKANLLSSNDENGKNTYSGNIYSNNLNIGKLLNNKKFGLVGFNLNLQGFNYQGKYPESSIKGLISSLEYSDYKYENITLDGIYKDGGFNGHLGLDDENAALQINGAFNIVQSVPEFNLRAELRNFRPHELNLSDKYENADISLNLTAQFTGNSIDDINGRILLDSLTMNAPDDRGYFLENLTVTARQVKGEKELKVESSFLTALVRGNYSYATVPASIVHSAKRYIPTLVDIKGKKIPKAHNNFRFDVKLENAEIFKKLFYIPIELHMPAEVNGYIDDDSEMIILEGDFPMLTYNGTLYESANLMLENPFDQLTCHLRGSMLMKSGAMLNLSLDAEAENDRLKTVLSLANNTDVTYGGQVAALTHFYKTKGKSPILQADIEILPTSLILNDTLWNIHSSHIALDSGRVFIDNFLIDRPKQLLRIDGCLSKEETDSCRIDLRNINVQYVLNMINFEAIEFGGMATGSVFLRRVLQHPMMQTQLHVKDFAVNDGIMGDADIHGVWDEELPGIRLVADMEEENLSSTLVTGYVSPAMNSLDLMIEADSTNLDLLKPYIAGIFSDLDGRVNGHVRLFGNFKTLDFEGQVSAKVSTKVDVLNAHLRVNNDSVYIRPGEFALQNVRITDREGNTGTINGSLRHTHLKNLNYDFNIQSNNLLLYDTNDPGDMLFYGKVYGSGNIELVGGYNAMRVEANLTTGPNTTFTYVTGLTAEATNNQFITFVDKTPRRIQDDIKTEFYHHSDARKKEEDTGPPMDMHINMMIDATPNATMRVIMDPVAGDDITARGNGNFQVNYYNKGDFRMLGNYVIDEGMYKLSMQEVIRKDFILQSGSTVSFTGDPYQANLDVQAVYTVNSVSLSDLSTDIQKQGTVKVNCLMNLTGSLASPSIKFDLELPTVNEEDRELVRSAISTEEQLNTQIIYLLGIGKFYAYDYNNRENQSSNATSSLAFSTLSGQLNSMLSQVMENKNWNIGANFSTGQAGWSNVEAEAILSGRLLNNRLLVNGNFGYRENVLANTNFIGDFEAIWLLTRDGDWRLRGYNQTNDRYFTKSTLTTQGIGLMYKKDFNIWNELFQWFIRKRNQKKTTSEKTEK